MEKWLSNSDYIEMFTLSLYKDKRVLLGYCASVAEMTREEFVKYLGTNGVSIFSVASENEFLKELVHA